MSVVLYYIENLLVFKKNIDLHSFGKISIFGGRLVAEINSSFTPRFKYQMNVHSQPSVPVYQKSTRDLDLVQDACKHTTESTQYHFNWKF